MAEIPLTDNEREYPNEYTEVERPLLVQLGAMGWQYVRGDLDYPQKTFRERFRDVLLRDKRRHQDGCSGSLSYVIVGASLEGRRLRRGVSAALFHPVVLPLCRDR